MKIIFRVAESLLSQIRADLARTHAFAFERVGFLSARATWAGPSLILLAQEYFPVADSDYLDDPSVGAKIGQEAFRKALELALLNPVGMFHIHMHSHTRTRRLWFSQLDLQEQQKFVPDFFKVRSDMPHGALVLSPETGTGRVWLSPERVEHLTEFNSIGSRVRVSRSAADGRVDFYA